MAALVVLGITLLGRGIVHVNPTTIALTFLLGVLGISTFWGLRQAVFMAISAALAFNYFFLPPVGTFAITDPQNWIALFAFLITAVTASELSERAGREARNANERLELDSTVYCGLIRRSISGYFPVEPGGYLSFRSEHRRTGVARSPVMLPAR